ncbi:hypothetical protein NTGM5_80049 [Candidatus Nitrotoga sp. M5]|nr:hypothetical protein NTGM5_80049 [Candidatus Nitrotoga sp. M5]
MLLTGILVLKRRTTAHWLTRRFLSVYYGLIVLNMIRPKLLLQFKTGRSLKVSDCCTAFF